MKSKTKIKKLLVATIIAQVLVFPVLIYTYAKKVPVPPLTGLLATNHTLTQAQLDTIRKYYEVLPNGVQLAISVIKCDTPHFIGLMRTRNKLKYIYNKNSLFEIGSVTKVFTAALLAHFVLEGRLHLEDSLSAFFPFRIHNYPVNGKEITLRSLANHTSGLPSMPKGFIFNSYIHFKWDEPYKDYDTNKLLSYLRNDCKLDFTPGERYQYSNLGFGILGYILCKRTGTTYETLLREIIFEPLGMKYSTTLFSTIQRRLVKGIYADKRPAPNWDMNAMEAAGGIKSTAYDLTKFIRAQFSPADSSFQMIQKITYQIDENKSIGLGWDIRRTKSGAYWYIRPGGTRGYECCVIMDPQKRNAVIVLSNISSTEDISMNVEYICLRLMELL